MELRIFTEPQEGAAYGDLLAVAQQAERLGFGAFFRSDHYQKIAGGGDGLPGSTDAWLTLAALARETSTIRLGTLVTSATFRLPGPLAISVAQVDDMSGGRVELGLGAGWYLAEHESYGIPFPPVGERFDRLEEQLEVITGLWRAEGAFDYEGAHYRIRNSPALPKPVQAGGPPLIIGGVGRKRTPALAARFAAEYNVPFHSVADTGAAFDRVRALADRELVYSAAQVVCCGKTEAQLAQRAAAIHREVDELRQNGLAGTPGELVDRIGRFAELGATRLYLQVLDLSDLDHLELVASEVMPQLG
ncbi:LLM class F420-dependent oxidoreductase [Actinocorallia sp. API 0066]|uniref:LLM class F420-dependent oxidoreductase n=1 Tax=Actinocorallia sp. API 0066 TaxID=2896846 RepID=UPI001E47469F|nr:LLM class F420-dependent oxidoreductase [Actinocorallia sp. API 0066]MCD0452724.1 LLM class F420-dependent oxidoreductase [Actinocorallia sp. API 0066]